MNQGLREATASIPAASTAGVRLGPWTVEPLGAGTRIEAPFQVPDGGGTRRGKLWFACRSHPLTPSGDALLAAGFFPALVRGCPLVIEAPASAGFMAQLPRLAEVFGSWLDKDTCFPVQVASRTTAGQSIARTATFFSGGVDSFHTSLVRLEEIATLVFVRGFDIAVNNRVLAESVVARLRQAATSMGRELIEVDTNVRELAEGLGCKWAFSHFAGMAAVAHVLSPHFSRFLIPSSHHYKELSPWGSSPWTDPWWGTESVTFEHHGAAWTRVAKVAELARHPVAMEHLRVCWSNRKGAYNCGVCEKCVRTMVNLRAVGALDRCRSFPVGLDLRKVARIRIEDPDTLSLVRENLVHVQQHGRDPALERALRYCHEQRFNRGFWRWMRQAWGWFRYP